MEQIQWLAQFRRLANMVRKFLLWQNMNIKVRKVLQD
jgi:hypothetical protein